MQHMLTRLAIILITASMTACGGGSSSSSDPATDTPTTDAPTTDAPALPSPVQNATIIVRPLELQFNWDLSDNTDHYRILSNPDGASGFTVVLGAENITTNTHTLSIQVAQIDWANAAYIIEACNADDSECVASEELALGLDSSDDAILYVKASATADSDLFGSAVDLDGDTLAVGARGDLAGAVHVFIKNNNTWQLEQVISSPGDGGDNFGISLSLDGDSLAIGAYRESSNATTINGDEANNDAQWSGAAYVYTRTTGNWSKQAYLKAANAEASDFFGRSVSLDGDTLAVGAYGEDGSATTINGAYDNNAVDKAGAVYVFKRDGVDWTQEAYIKTSETAANDFLGYGVALQGDTLVTGARNAGTSGKVYVFTRDVTTWSEQAILSSGQADNDDFGNTVALDGTTIAVGAYFEESAASGIGGDESDNNASGAGAVYVYTGSGASWTRQAYIKASNPTFDDWFGWSISLDGDSMAVGAPYEGSSAVGLNGNEIDETALYSGAVYLFERNSGVWSQKAYLKASNTGGDDTFGWSVSHQNGTLVIGAEAEKSYSTGIDGDQADDNGFGIGAVYIY